MKTIRHIDGATYQPDPGWRRIQLAGSDHVSVEYFEKPPGHSSVMHSHEQEQICVVIKGRMKVVVLDGVVELEATDSVWFAPNESHRIENPGDEMAAGLDIFVPARDFAFWTNRKSS